MPLNIDFVQILLHMLNFVILAGGLTLILFKPVTKFLNERKEYYEKLMGDTEAARLENEAMKAEYTEKLKEVEEEIAEKKETAEKEAADLAKQYLDNAKEKAEAIIRNAETDAENRKAHILESAQAEIEELVIESTEKLLNETGSAERDRKLYDEFIRLVEEPASK